MPSVAECWFALRCQGGESSSSKEGEGARCSRRPRIELDLARSSSRFFLDGLGANVEELVRDDVEAMELGWVKIAYVVDFEGPALRPRSC